MVAAVASSGSGNDGKRICVLGAGVIGLSSAVRLAEELENVQVSVPVRDVISARRAACQPSSRCRAPHSTEGTVTCPL